MILSDEAIQEFKEIYKRDYGVDLSDGDAYEQAHRCFNMMQAIYRPIPGKDDK